MPTPQLQFLDSLLRGERPDQDALQALLDRRVKEDLHLEYKAADWLEQVSGKEHRNPKQEIRKYVSGFANAAGGVLVIGVAEPTDDGKLRTLDPVRKWASAEQGENWLSDYVVPLGPYLSPPPRFVCVEVDGGFVAVVAVPRSLALVPCEEQSHLQHYVRMHDKTLKAPSYLVQDLVLGRRQQPVVSMSATMMAQHNGSHSLPDAVTAKCTFVAVNEGLVWLNQPVIGALLPSVYSTSIPIPDSLLNCVSFDPGVKQANVQFVLGLHGHPIGHTVTPFGQLNAHFPNAIQFAFPGAGDWAIGCAAVVLSRGHAPLWFQVRFEVHMDRFTTSPHGTPTPVSIEGSVCAVTDGRPVLYIRPIESSPA